MPVTSKTNAHIQALREALAAMEEIMDLPAGERAAWSETVHQSAKIMEAAGCYIRRANAKGTL